MVSVGWWLVRRKLRKRAHATAARFVDGTGLSRRAPRRRHALRNLLFAGTVAAAAYALWKRLRGGSDDDDWGTWEPEPPAPAASAESTSTTA